MNDNPGFGLTHLKTRTFRPLRTRNIRLYMLGMLVSEAGTYMQMVAEGWLVYQLTNSAFSLGLVGFIVMIPLAPLGLAAGALADRMSRKKLLAIAQIGEMVPPLVLAALTVSGYIQVWHVIAADIAMGVLSTIDFPSRVALIQSLVEPEDLENGIALAATMSNLARVIGPAIAGVLIVYIGVAGAFAFNGVSFLAVLVALALMKIPNQSRVANRGSIGANLIEGGMHVLHDRTILLMLVLMMLVSFFVLTYQTLLPVFARDILVAGPEGLGFLTAAAGAGAVVGAIVLAIQPPLSTRRRLGLAVGMFIAIAPITAAFAFSRILILSAFLLALVSGGAIALRILTFTYVHLRTGDHLRGRISSILQLSMVSTLRVGGLFAGAFASKFGAPVSLGAGASICLIAGLLALGIVFPRLRTVEPIPVGDASIRKVSNV